MCQQSWVTAFKRDYTVNCVVILMKKQTKKGTKNVKMDLKSGKHLITYIIRMTIALWIFLGKIIWIYKIHRKLTRSSKLYEWLKVNLPNRSVPFACPVSKPDMQCGRDMWLSPSKFNMMKILHFLVDLIKCLCSITSCLTYSSSVNCRW